MSSCFSVISARDFREMYNANVNASDDELRRKGAGRGEFIGG